MVDYKMRALEYRLSKPHLDAKAEKTRRQPEIICDSREQESAPGIDVEQIEHANASCYLAILGNAGNPEIQTCPTTSTVLGQYEHVYVGTLESRDQARTS